MKITFSISAESKVVKFIPENYLNPYLSSKNVLNNLVQACQTGGPINCSMRPAGIFSVPYMIRNSKNLKK